ncbi:thermonuclease family protein [Candidatus Roizmanbacteria bacterium]|nr:thermonuclease family protein [Candidatus Roizmanbacteria bacterium]
MNIKVRLSKKKIATLLTVLVIFFQLIFNRKSLNIASFFLTPTIKKSISETFKVTRVIDGDTVEIEDKRRIRYIGINSPELHDPRRPIQCFGQQAYEENKKLAEGKTIRLEKDVSETDKYKRLLRYVYVGDIFINDYLVRQGFAQKSTFPPDVKYADLFADAQKEAEENNRGLWATCPLKQK